MDCKDDCSSWSIRSLEALEDHYDVSGVPKIPTLAQMKTRRDEDKKG